MLTINNTITVAAVPEWSTWARLGAGVGTLLVTRQFRRRLS